ncbi:MAG: NADH:ubiquinone reductase (Na(+)-transporting) subunit B [Candidatus Marinimicrobia bacterium]|nr:NADH:ubiquinone reductase (Na(+)-transporting) subunit B [Candidatus Neomarinimicrobiota bacterium]
MKMLRNFLDRMHPKFKNGTKLEKYYPLFEMADTFMFTPDDVTKSGPHVRDAVDLKRAMIVVVLALLPTFFFGLFNIGYQEDATRTILQNFMVGLKITLPILIVAYGVGGFWEVVFAIVRKHEINEGFLVTGFLIPLIVPPTIPLWMVAVATSFGVVIGKEIFGGTGFNIFNPALVARAFLFFAYPGAISGDSVWTVVDGVSKATPLAVAASGVNTSAIDLLVRSNFSWLDMFYGFIPGSIGETSTLAILIGAVILLVTRIASWRIITGVMIGMVGIALLTNLLAAASSNPMLALTPHYHLVMGGFAFGMVFMATDPVSAAQSNAGRWIYGIMIGGLAVMIRSVNPAFPEGMMLAILLGNAFSPMIDYMVLRRHIKRRQQRHA